MAPHVDVHSARRGRGLSQPTHSAVFARRMQVEVASAAAPMTVTGGDEASRLASRERDSARRGGSGWTQLPFETPKDRAPEAAQVSGPSVSDGTTFVSGAWCVNYVCDDAGVGCCLAVGRSELWRSNA